MPIHFTTNPLATFLKQSHTRESIAPLTKSIKNSRATKNFPYPLLSGHFFFCLLAEKLLDFSLLQPTNSVCVSPTVLTFAEYEFYSFLFYWEKKLLFLYFPVNFVSPTKEHSFNIFSQIYWLREMSMVKRWNERSIFGIAKESIEGVEKRGKWQKGNINIRAKIHRIHFPPLYCLRFGYCTFKGALGYLDREM